MTPAVPAINALRDQLARLFILPGAPEALTEWELQLADLPPAVLAAAVTHALRTRVFFPVPAELRADADAADTFALVAPVQDRDRERALPQPFTITLPVPDGAPVSVQVEREWRYDCAICSDSGWAEYWCGVRPAREGASLFLPTHRCQRLTEHGGHAWAMPCGCVEINPTIARRKAAQRQKFAQAAEKAGR
jgi:hypothetical protein